MRTKDAKLDGKTFHNIDLQRFTNKTRKPQLDKMSKPRLTQTINSGPVPPMVLHSMMQ